jgi:hypothetical protein
MAINLGNYPVLNGYEILAETAITTVNTTTVTNGNYGSPTGITGTFVGTLDTANTAAAQTELTALVSAIQAITPTSTSSTTTINTAVTYTPGRTDYTSSLTFDIIGGDITFDAQGDSAAQFFITVSATISFTNLSQIVLANGACAGNIFWVSGVAILVNPPFSFYGNMIARTQIVSSKPRTFNGRMYAQIARVDFSGTSSANGVFCSGGNTGNPTNNNNQVVCYAKGTKINTPNGYIPIEDLKLGDRVTINGRIENTGFCSEKETSRPIIWLSKFRINTRSRDACPIRIKAGALGENTPFEDLYVSPGHRIIVDNKILQAKYLINETTITQEFQDESVTYYHVELQCHYSIVANGVKAESYYDINTRHLFEKSKKLVARNNMKSWYAQKTC